MSTTQQSYLSSSSLTPPSGGWGVRVLLTNAGKRFNRDWIFRHVTFSFETGKSYAITGPNGSGKSTLLQAIAGSLVLSEGKMEYRTEEQGTRNKEQGSGIEHSALGIMPQNVLDPEKIYLQISIVAPYLELIEEMTAKEFLHFHASFKPLINVADIDEMLSIIGLEKAAHKQIRYFSSGMKQRIKLAQAIFSDVPVLLLDEPCTNLDKPGYDLYHSLIENYAQNKLIVVSSNDANEMDFCTARLSILDYK